MAHLAAEEEVVPQPAIEILDNGTGSGGLSHRLQDRLLDPIPSAFQPGLYRRHPLPIEAGPLVQRLDLTQGLYAAQRHAKPLGNGGELLLQHRDKGQKARPLVA